MTMDPIWLDIQHRGYEAYLKEAGNANHPDLACIQKESEHFDTVLTDCKIKTDWIEQIEAALPFIENAVHENRQFILRQGETVPIEKAKRASRVSVEHLSRHSELITTLPNPGEDLIPEKLHVTENIGTYAVYENRFLYMLLCYVRDFTAFRYRKISELQASFSSDIAITKEITGTARTIRYALRYSESFQGLEEMLSQENGDTIGRIRRILQTAELLLRTGLMKEVSAAPMLKPPITRTNVMLHDPNFKAAFSLYSYLSSYTEDGFEKVERYRESGQFSDDMRADFAALMALTSYLSYRSGGMREELDLRFQEEEKRRQEASEQAKRELIAALRKQLGEIDGPALPYILALEQRNAELESSVGELHLERSRCAAAQDALNDALAQSEQLQDECGRLETAIRAKEDALQQLTRSLEQAKHDAQQQSRQFHARLEDAAQRHAAELDQQKQDFLREYETLMAQLHLANARNRAAALQQGSSEEDFITREAFAQLEAEYTAFRRFYEQQWKLAKKQIRRQQLWKKDDQ